jgi:hypothetical protein
MITAMVVTATAMAFPGAVVVADAVVAEMALGRALALETLQAMAAKGRAAATVLVATVTAAWARVAVVAPAIETAPEMAMDRAVARERAV